MNIHGQYEYSPYLWPFAASIVFLLIVAAYSWRCRSIAGAIPFVVVSLFNALWLIGATFEVAAVSVPTRIFWHSFRAGIVLVPITAMLCFAIEYAGLGSHLTRRALAVLSIPPLLLGLFALTNEAHHLLWTGFTFDGPVQPVSGPVEWVLMSYGYVLSLAIVIILVWLFIRSPLHRLPVALIVFGVVVTRTAFVIDIVGYNPIPPLDLISASIIFAAGLYTLALFGVRMFEPIPVARKMVVEQMREGMLVLDNRQQIVDLNHAAEAMLGAPAASLRGREAAEVLPGWAAASLPASGRATQPEISLGIGPTTRHYTLQPSPLLDKSGHAIGRLLLLHDVTEQMQAQAQLLEHQRVVATLQERERLARELHDSTGQVLGYVSMQAQAINKRVRDGELAIAAAQLDRLAQIACEAHNDIRESILSLKTGAPESWAFLDGLRRYLDAFGHNYGIDTWLSLQDDLDESDFAPGMGVQLLRVIQEALTNARKHGDAHCVRVEFTREDGQANINVTDDGRGFDAAGATDGTGGHYGLSFMRERMEQIGGHLAIDSQPGAGTRVVLHVPIQNGHGENDEGPTG